MNMGQQTTDVPAEKRTIESKGIPGYDHTSTAVEREEKEDGILTNLVQYDGPNDLANPYNWSKTYKWTLLVVLSGLSLTTNLTVLVCAPATPQILQEFHSDNNLDATLIVTIWNLGATIGCLIMGPLSEIYGRLPVYNLANLLCLVMLVAQTQSRNIAMVIAFRCLNGLTIATTALNPSIVGDMFKVEERGRAQSLLSLMPLLGPVLGPIAGGWIAQAKGWRWTFWFAFFTLSFFSICFLLLYRETYEAVLLRRKAHRLRQKTGNTSLHSQYDHDQSSSSPFLKAFQKAFIRPLKIFLIPIFLILTVSSCVLLGYVYLIATSITQVMETTYNFSEGAAGLSFLGIATGMAIGSFFCSMTLDRYTKKMKARHPDGKIEPEWRLPPMTLGFIISPIGLFIYGWTAQYHIHWIVPIMATALCGAATYMVTLPATTYLVDVFGVYRASAMSALMMSRNAINTVLPLAGPALYSDSSLGLGWGNSVLAFIALAMAPLPFLLLRFGARIRLRSKIERWS